MDLISIIYLPMFLVTTGLDSIPLLLKKGGRFKVPLFQGDLGGSKIQNLITSNLSYGNNDIYETDDTDGL
jgi:hypothetical protein